MTFLGNGVNEVIFITRDPGVSDCPYKGQFVMFTKERPAMLSGLLSAFQAQNAVVMYGTGQCDSAWKNHEVINYATFKI